MEERALFVADGDFYVGTILIQGGWNPDEANGGAVLALLGHCLEDVPSLVPMFVSRFTVDLQRPVPLGKPLRVVSTILREGKKIQVVLLQVLVGDVEHVRATALRLRIAEIESPELPTDTSDDRPADAMVPPDRARTMGEGSPQLPGFLGAIDMRRSDLGDGPGWGCWVRLAVPVVAGEPIRPTSQLTFAFDYANLIAVDGHPDLLTMINPDVSAHVLRPPTSEWIAITGETRFNPAMGRGLSWATLSDGEGPFAVVSMSQLLQHR